jgi:hypothetical protein
MEKPVVIKKFVFKTTQICVATTQNFSTQERLQTQEFCVCSQYPTYFFFLLPRHYTQYIDRIPLIHPKTWSGVDNWHLNEFFEEFICGCWYIYLGQTIYHLCRPISCWLTSFAVEYHLLRTIISYAVWYLSPADDIQLKQMILIWRGWYSSRADNVQLKQMILIWRGRYSSRADDIHPMETKFIQKRQISSMMIDSWNYNQPLEMIFNHWGS